MAYMNGTFQYFDNTFLWDRRDYPKPVRVEYASDTLFGYLQEHHPKWLVVLKKAQRENLFSFQPNSSYTLFVPVEESIPEDLITSMDRNTATVMFNYHTLKGQFDKEVLMTARFQYLNTLIDGQSIYYLTTPDGIGVLNRIQTILKYDIQFGNVTVHVVSGMLS